MEMSFSAADIDLDFSLKGKIALVTGGASGIGAAIAAAYVRKGAKVAVVDVNQDNAAAKASELGEAAKPFSCDVSSSESVRKMVADVVAAFGRIDILVNCAGVVFLAPAETLPLDYWDKTIAINLKGSFLVTQSVGQAMIKAGKGGRIINLASQAGTVAIEEHVAYCASKFGVLTELGKKAWAGEKGEAAVRRIPTGRFAIPEEIATAAVFLASSGAAMINGADLLIDGGYTIL